jgi:RHS repeat-associated protein
VKNTYHYGLLNNRTAVLSDVLSGKPQPVSTAIYADYNLANQQTALHIGSGTGPLVGAMVYDDNGNLIKQCTGGTVLGGASNCFGATITAMTYDALNRTTQITKTGQPTQSYDYDDQNRRIRKTVGGTVNNYLYQDQENILAEYANGWAAATGFITHGATTDVPLIWQPPANDPVGPRYFHQDGLGSIVAMTTTTGVTATERFDDWGNKLTGSGAIPIYGYTGREQDGTPTTGTGFIYYRARYYDPANARFTQSDPIELKGGINAYTYVGGNPIVRVDPTGLTYGTTDCSYYKQQCQASGGSSVYYCDLALSVCSMIPEYGNWTSCVRQCLQDADMKVCAPTGSGCTYAACTIIAHDACWLYCDY